MNDSPAGWEPLDRDCFLATEFDLLEQEDEIRHYLHEKLRDQAITAQITAREATEPGSTLYNPAYLAGAAATLADINADLAEAHRGQRPDPAQQDRLGSAADDLAAAEAAITLLRENRDRHGYTQEDAATARTLREVLDTAKVWDHVTTAAPTHAAEPGPLEAGLRPDRVRSRPGWDDTVILDAGFAGAVTIQRTPGPTSGAAAEYVFLASGPGGRGPLRDVDTKGIGVIAAGDRAARPARADVYANLGAQVRQHLIELADAVATHQEALHTKESRRTETAQIDQVSHSRPGPGRSQ